jgi:chromosome segregation ATPase
LWTGTSAIGAAAPERSPRVSDINGATTPLTEHDAEVRDLRARVGQLERELEAYRRAKQENDERFMVERDEARARADAAEAAYATLDARQDSAAKALEQARAARDRNDLEGLLRAIAGKGEPQ